VTGALILDLDEGMGLGVIEKEEGDWLHIRWLRLGSTWGTPRTDAVIAILRQEWIFLDAWCDEIVRP
jgi:hypothetical protein